jgi:multidrug efflux system membrane fusion protein
MLLVKGIPRLAFADMPTATDSEAVARERGVRLQRMRRIGLIAAVVIIIVAAILIWRHHAATEAAAAAARRAPAPRGSVMTTTARSGDINVYLDAIGTVTPVYTVSITSQVNGPVVAVNYREGQLVHKGESLIEVDARPYRATLLQAQGILERDQNVLGQAQMDLVRYRAALARNAIAQQMVDDQEKLVLQDQGTVKNDEGTVQYDQLQVEYCHIVSPINGQIGLRLVDPGNIVQANGTSALAVIAQLQPITVIFTLPEDSLSPVLARLHDHAKLDVDVFDRSAQKKIASGALLALDNQIDTTTGTVKVRAQFDNADNALFPNQFVNARLLVNTLQGVTLVPASAVQQNGQSSYVYVIQNNVAHVRPVKTGVTDSGSTQVDSVKAGEVLADSSFDKLQDNARVSIVSKPAATGAPAAAPAAGSAAAPAAAPGAAPGAAAAASAAPPASSGSGRTSAP